MSRVYAIIAAAGQSLRMGIPNKNKVFITLSGKSVLELTLRSFVESGCFDGIAIVTQKKDRSLAKNTAALFPEMLFYFADGGETRQDSVLNAIHVLPKDARIIAVQDAARCFTDKDLIIRCIESAEEYGSGVACRMSTDTVKLVEGNEIRETLDRSHIALAQTPQVFSAELLIKAHEQAKLDGFIGTDDAQLVERLGVKPILVESSKENFKLTYRSDIKKGENMIGQKNAFRIGNGIDIHAFAEGRKLILGGVEVESEKGLLGHSDADVLIHAVMDALLGAAGLPDIGQQFPDKDERYRGISSMILLGHTMEKLTDAGFMPSNIDATLILQAPKIAKYIPQMKENIENICHCPVNIKATTPEWLGYIGRGEGAEAHAVCMIEEI